MRLFVKTYEFKAAMSELLDAVEIRPGWQELFRERAAGVIDQHRMALGDEYISALVKLLAAEQRDRAHRLVDCFDDVERTYLGNVVVALLRWAIKLGALAAFVVAVMWLYGKLEAT